MSDLKEAAGDSRRVLRSVPQSDLLIVLGKMQTEHRMSNSYLLAFHSEYVDTMLANDMAEKEAHRLTFPDIELVQWDLLMSLLEDKEAIATATVEDVMTVLPFYNKYQFQSGKATWDRFLATHLDNMDHDNDFDAIIDLSEFAVQHHLQATLKAGATFLQSILGGTLYVRLTHSHIAKVASLFYLDEQLSKVFEGFTLDQDFVLSSHFSTFVMRMFELTGARRTIKKARPESMTVKIIDKATEQSTKVNWMKDLGYSGLERARGHCWKIKVSRYDATTDWTIIRQDSWNCQREQKLWTCPGSVDMAFPPKTGWKTCCAEADKMTMELIY